MIFKKLLLVLIFFILLFSFSAQIYAVYDPLSVSNNYIGIHILFPEEIDSASKLVNANGDWGYVTIPIQAGDKDLDKWQKFMDDCARLHIIPIVRLATEAYFSDTKVWRKPTDEDIIDFANFLNSLTWPTQNRYIVLFNEVNRYDEWGGEAPNAAEYTQLVDFAVDAFKARSPDFYIILAGLDNAAPSDGTHYVGNFLYLLQIANYNSKIFDRIDGFASHSYPNPGFDQPPNETFREGIATYRYEYKFINSYTSTKKPAFITETGWNDVALSEDVISQYFTNALSNIWGKDQDKIVAITPFLLDSEQGGFNMFSFTRNGHNLKFYTAIQSFPKVSGKPVLTVIQPSPTAIPSQKILGTETFNAIKNIQNPVTVAFKSIIKKLLGIGKM